MWSSRFWFWSWMSINSIKSVDLLCHAVVGARHIQDAKISINIFGTYAELSCSWIRGRLGKEMVVVWSHKGCQFKCFVTLGIGDHAAVFGVLASGAVPSVGAWGGDFGRRVGNWRCCNVVKWKYSNLFIFRKRGKPFTRHVLCSSWDSPLSCSAWFRKIYAINGSRYGPWNLAILAMQFSDIWRRWPLLSWI